MPDLKTSLHLNMLRRYKISRSVPLRILDAIKNQISAKEIYGMHWGDPDDVPPLRFIRDQYVLPFVKNDQTALEIGPGGGRWTQYLLNFQKLYVVDYHAELLDELKQNFDRSHMIFVNNNGTDFPGVDADSIDFLFSFGTFVHLDAHLIEAYLENMKAVLKVGANVVIQYSDQTKVMAQRTKGFANNTPEKMRKMVVDAGYQILEEDTTTMWHSSLIHFSK